MSVLGVRDLDSYNFPAQEKGEIALAISQERIGQIVQTAFRVLSENDDHLPSREIIRRCAERLNLTLYELEALPSGIVRWENTLHWYTVDSVKAGWLVKRNGVWYLTQDGRNALELDPLTFFRTASGKYNEAIAARSSQAPDVTPRTSDLQPSSSIADVSRTLSTTVDNAESLARSEIERFINALGPYEFQDLVAGLLRGMGYHTPFIAPVGKDGGLDILAYRDPLGSSAPRLKVQVKHRGQKVTVKEVRELLSLLTKDGDAGLLVSSGGFTSEAEAEIRRAARHIEKIDLNGLIDMWDDHYDAMEEEDRRLMPLRRVAFLAPSSGT
jgi:restriction system protein